jgi:hypothetical protein
VARTGSAGGRSGGAARRDGCRFRTQSRTRVRRESPRQVPETLRCPARPPTANRTERQRPAIELVQHSSARGHVAGVPRAFAVIAVTARRHLPPPCRGHAYGHGRCHGGYPCADSAGSARPGRRAASRADRSHGAERATARVPGGAWQRTGQPRLRGRPPRASQGNSRRKMHVPPQWVHEVTPVSACYPRTVGASRRHAAECCWEAVTRAADPSDGV